MTLPVWNDPKLEAGTMVRAALWLLTEIGVGNTFTKEQVRKAFPGVAQADRRIRDLRKHGWVIHTRSDDVTLNAEEQRFVTAGKRVWEEGEARSPDSGGPTAKQRQAVLERDGFQCVICGVAGGETYPDSASETAVLSLAKVGTGEAEFVTRCKRCRAGSPATISADSIAAEIAKLTQEQRSILVSWIQDGRRSRLDRIWAAFRQMSSIEREKVSSLVSKP